MGTDFAYSTLTRLRAGEFIYPKLMAWEGAFGVVPADCDGCYVSPEYPVFEIRADQADPRFIDFYFKNPQAWKSISAGSTGTNIRRRRLNPSDLLRQEISLPPLSAQRRIAATLDKVAVRSEQIRKHIAAQRYDFQNLLRVEFARIAKNAPRRAMNEIAPLVRRIVNVDVNAEYSELGVRSFGKGTFHKAALTGADLGSKRVFRIKPGDLVFMNVFAWEGAIAIARVEDEGRVGSHRFITCVPEPDAVTANFLRFYFLTPEGLERIGKASPGSAGRNRTLGISALMGMPIPTPPLQQQTWFDAICRKVAEANLHADAQVSDLDALERSMLATAFRGGLSDEEGRAKPALQRPADARDYLVQFVPALLRAAEGSLPLERITEAYALLFLRTTLFALLAKTGGQAARRHFQHSPPLDENAYRKILNELYRTGAIASDPTAPTTHVRLKETDAPPPWPMVAEDAKYLAALLNLVPHEALQTTVRKLCPEPPRKILLAMK